MDSFERMVECLYCEYFDKCYREVEVPEDYLDGSCKTKEKFKNKISNRTTIGE